MGEGLPFDQRICHGRERHISVVLYAHFVSFTILWHMVCCLTGKMIIFVNVKRVKREG